MKQKWVLLCAFCASCAAAVSAQEARFLSFAEARETLSAFGRTDDGPAWDAWIRAQDREVRARVDRGVEDSISNLILYGTSFTALPPLAIEAAVTSAGTLTEAARARIRAMSAAAARPEANERLRIEHEFLARCGIQPKDAETFLAANLTRFGKEQREYQEKLRLAAVSGDPQESLLTRATLYDRRGLSVDTSLLPNYALEDTLAAMLRKGAISAGHIRNIAVIGPGLDFADKRDGYDFYPVQTIQPFAMLEAVERLGLADPNGVRLVAFDLNPAVIAHLRLMVERARCGTPCVIHLPRDVSSDWTPQALAYWEHFGERIGSPSASAAAPKGIVVRAIAVQAKYASRIESRDLNVVGQVVDGEAFDLVVATNILVYYDRFQQALALNGIARMMGPGGVFLSNTVLPAQRPAALEYLGRRSVSYSASGSYGDDVVAYRRK
jgi:CheR methyltransferase, SAM binding domain